MSKYEMIKWLQNLKKDIGQSQHQDLWHYAEMLDEVIGTIEVSDEDEVKFYYVESVDDYWIGQRLDNFYYAEWEDRLGFVWTHSRYLPWGEHVVAPDTLWKEHTYPSEPREIPFTEWIVGFMKKHTSEDAISRADLIQELRKDAARVEMEEFANDTVWRTIGNAPSVLPKRSCYRCGLRENCEDSTVRKPKEGEWTNAGVLTVHCSNCKSEFHELEAMNYCPNCGAKMRLE